MDYQTRAPQPSEEQRLLWGRTPCSAHPPLLIAAAVPSENATGAEIPSVHSRTAPGMRKSSYTKISLAYLSSDLLWHLPAHLSCSTNRNMSKEAKEKLSTHKIKYRLLLDSQTCFSCWDVPYHSYPLRQVKTFQTRKMLFFIVCWTQSGHNSVNWIERDAGELLVHLAVCAEY